MVKQCRLFHVIISVIFFYLNTDFSISLGAGKPKDLQCSCLYILRLLLPQKFSSQYVYSQIAQTRQQSSFILVAIVFRSFIERRWGNLPGDWAVLHISFQNSSSNDFFIFRNNQFERWSWNWNHYLWIFGTLRFYVCSSLRYANHIFIIATWQLIFGRFCHNNWSSLLLSVSFFCS